MYSENESIIQDTTSSAIDEIYDLSKLEKDDWKKENIELKILKSQDPIYPTKAKINAQSGKVSLIIIIDENTNVVESIIEESSGLEILDKAAQRATRLWKISVKKNGINIKAKTRVKIEFKLK